MSRGSLFAAIAPANARTYTREAMLAMSQAIEDQALASGGVHLILALFQQGANAARQAARYQRLHRHASRVVVLGYDLPAGLLPGIGLVELAPGDPLRDEWAVLVLGDSYQALLTARERARRPDGFGRSYHGAWTFDAAIVRRAAVVLGDLIRGYDPDLHLSLPDSVGRTAHRTLEAGAARMLAYVERNAERVRERERQLRERTRELEQANLEMIARLAWAAEQKDQETADHLWRVTAYTEVIGRAMKLGAAELERLTLAAPLHDVGKLHVEDALLRKPGRLTPEEFEQIKTHTLAGSRILADSPARLVQIAQQIARWHHERWDGTGYPDGLRGVQTPSAARIVSVADVFDALTSRRPYKEPFPFDESLSIIAAGRGTQFDPDVVDAFLGAEEEVRRIAARDEDGGRFRWLPGEGGYPRDAGTAASRGRPRLRRVI